MQAQRLRGIVREWRRKRSARHDDKQRWREIRADLGAATGDVVLLAGNSHAALLGNPDFAGRPCINIGVGGLTARGFAARIARLDAPVRSAAAILLIGTNDIQRRRHPERAATQLRFEADIRRVLRTLDALARNVFVAAVPPIGACATSRDPAAVATFSASLDMLCAEGGHTFFDPFATMRGVEPGLAVAGLYPDGVHLADYPALARDLARVVDTALSAPPVRMPWIAAASPEATEGRRVPLPPATRSLASPDALAAYPA